MRNTRPWGTPGRAWPTVTLLAVHDRQWHYWPCMTNTGRAWPILPCMTNTGLAWPILADWPCMTDTGRLSVHTVHWSCIPYTGRTHCCTLAVHTAVLTAPSVLAVVQCVNDTIDVQCGRAWPRSRPRSCQTLKYRTNVKYH